MTWVEYNGNTIDLNNVGIRTKDFIVSSPMPRHVTDEITGSDGLVDLGSTIGPREIICHFKVTADEYNNFGNKRDEVFDIFKSTESFYLIEKRVPGKRWKVKVADQYAIEQLYVYGDFEVPFMAFSGFSESIGTTTMASTFDHLQDLPVTYTDYKDIYATKFKVYNAGQLIDPRNVNNFLKITYKGEAENLRIRNLTTGDEWVYNGPSNASDEIVLEGIRSTKNGLSIFRETNKRLITLAHGWNEFEISGVSEHVRLHAIQAHQPNKKVDSDQLPNPLTFEFKYRW